MFISGAKVPAFSQDEIDNNWPIWDLFQNGAIVLFKSVENWEAAINLLEKENYKVCRVDCAAETEKPLLLRSIVEALGISCYAEGPNLDGFNDFIRDVDFEGCNGVVLALSNFDAVNNRSPELAKMILAILADNQRIHMLTGNRLLTIVQSNDPDLHSKIGIVGGFQPTWNSKEWLNANR